MALDVATLGLKVDTTDLKAGGVELDKFAAKGARTEKSVQKVGVAAERAGRQMKAHGHSLRMASMQLSQVAQQGAVTGNYLGALAVQLPDLALGLGPIGILGGVAAGALLQFGVSALGTSKDLEELDDQIAALSQSIRALERATESASLSGSNLLGDFGLQADQAREMLSLRRQLAEVVAERAFMGASAAASSALGGDLIEGVATEELEHVRVLYTTAEQLFKAYSQQIADQMQANSQEYTAEGQARLMQLQQWREEQRQIISETSSVVGAVRQIGEALGANVEINDAFGVAIAMANVEAAKGADERIAAMGELRAAIELATDGFALTNEEALKLVQHIFDAEEAGLVFQEMDLAAGPREAAEAAAVFSQELWDAVSAANQLAGLGVDGGRGGDPRKFERDTYWRDTYFPKPERPKRKTKRGTGSTSIASEAEREAQAMLRATRSMEKYLAVLEVLNKMHESGEITTQQYTDAIDQLDERYKDVTGAAGEFDELNQLLKEGILDLAMEGSSAMDSLGRAIQRAALEAALFGEGPLASVFDSVFGGSGGGLIGKIFGGFKAGGGPVSAGKGYIVGEEGPEWFEPGTSGTIIPNHALSSGRGQSVVRLELSAELEARILQQARNQSIEITQAGIEQFSDKALPDRFSEISNDPRARG